MIKKLLQIFSFFGAFLGLLILIYLPFVFWFVVFSLFFIVWGIVSFMYCSENSKYRMVLRVFSIVGGALAIVFIIFAIWGFISVGLSLILRNFLILALSLGIFTLVWSFLALKCLNIIGKIKLNHEKEKK